MSLSLKQIGNTLTGDVVISDPLEGDGPIHGTIESKHVEFSVDSQLFGVAFTIAFRGDVLSDGTLAGDFNVVPAGGQGIWRVHPKYWRVHPK